MANQYLASGLITDIRDSGMLPPADESANTTRMLSFLNGEQRLFLTRLMLSVRENHRVATVDVTLVAGTTSYRIPSRAVGAKLKLVELIDSSGAVGRPLQPINAGNVYQGALVGGPGDFKIQDNSIVFLASPAAGTMRIHYFRRLNKIVDSTATSGAITAINTTTKVVTVSIVDAAIPTTFVTGATYDLIQGKPHFDLLGSDLAISAVNATTMTFSATPPTDLAVGDFVALAGETPICMAPLELHDVLVQSALVVYLESTGDGARAAMAAKTLERMREDALSILAPRVEGTPEALVNYNAPGWGRSRRRYR